MSTKLTSAPMTATSSAQSSAPASTDSPAAPPATTLAVDDISSPQQLVDWVDNALSHLETRFEDMNAQVASRMNEMSTRIDALESSIQGLIHSSIAPIAQD